MSEFSQMPDMDSPKPVNDFETGWNTEIMEDRLELYTIYGDHIFESLEDFCSRMHDKFGEQWILILKRK